MEQYVTESGDELNDTTLEARVYGLEMRLAVLEQQLEGLINLLTVKGALNPAHQEQDHEHEEEHAHDA